MNDKLETLSAERAYAPSSYRDSRDAQGNLSYVSGAARLQLLAGLPVINVETGAEEVL